MKFGFMPCGRRRLRWENHLLLKLRNAFHEQGQTGQEVQSAENALRQFYGQKELLT